MTGVEEGAALAALAEGASAAGAGAGAAGAGAAGAGALEAGAAVGALATELGAADLAAMGAGAEGLLGATAAVPGVAESAMTALPSVGGNGFMTGLGYGPSTVGVNEFGLSGLPSISGGAANTQFMTAPLDQMAAVGGAGQSLGTTVAEASQLTGEPGFWGQLSSKMTDPKNMMQMGSKVIQGNQKKPAQRAPMIIGDPSNGFRQTKAFSSIAPYPGYSQFGGGFNPQAYKNKFKSGLL